MATRLYDLSLFNDANLVSYWRFDETSGTNLVDSKGSNDLTAQNSAMVGATGKFDYGINTSTYYASIASVPANLKPSAFSVSFWIKGTGWASNYCSVMKVWNSSGNDSGWRVDTMAGGTILFITAGNHGPGQNCGRSVTGNIADNTWHHVVVTLAGTASGSAMKGYVDAGTPISTTSCDTLDYSNVGYVEVGHPQSTSAIDDLAIFSKVLTPSEISHIYTGLSTSDNSTKSNTKTTYYSGCTYDWKPSYEGGQNRGYQS